MRVELSRSPMMKGFEHQARSLGAMMWPPASNLALTILTSWCSGLCVSLCHQNRADLGVHWAIDAMLECGFRGWVMTGMAASALLSSHSLRGKAAFHSVREQPGEGVTCGETEASGRQPLYEGVSVEGSCSSRQTS